MRLARPALLAIVLASAPARAGTPCRADWLRAVGVTTVGALDCHARAAERGLGGPSACPDGALPPLPRRRDLGCTFAPATGGPAGQEVSAFVGDVLGQVGGDVPGCVEARLTATDRQITAALRAHAANELVPRPARLARRLARAQRGLARVLPRRERRAGCRRTVDAGHLAGTVDAFADEIRSFLDEPLRSLADTTSRWIGSAVRVDALAGDPEYGERLAREFNYVTPEDAMKWGPIHPAPDVWDFAGADSIVDFAEAHGMRVKGTLLWDYAPQLPGYVQAGLSAAEMQHAIEEHVRALVGRYRGRVAAWDVVNEAVDEGGLGLRPSIFLQALGPDYIAMAFRLAHEADPDAILLYNDYLADDVNPKADYIHAMLAGLLAAAVPVHGVGLQMHLVGGLSPAADGVRANMERFQSLGLLVHITEIDVRVRALPRAVRQTEQRRIYHDMVGACLAVPRCDAITFWGFTDRYSWVDRFFGADDPLLLDELYRRKPAYFGVRDALLGQ